MTYEEYFDAVTAELADLPDEDRTELLDDVAGHLAEVAAEDAGPLDARLGSPEAYAADLRAAAGLPPRGATSRLPRLVRLRAMAARVEATRGYREVRAFAPELRPAWWVARGYLAVVALAALNGRPMVPIPELAGSTVVGFAACAVAVVGSVAIGRRPRFAGWRRIALVAVNGVAVVAAAHVYATISDRATGPYFVASKVSPGIASSEHGPLLNVVPYDRDGRPLDGVTLLDQDGASLTDYLCIEQCGMPYVPAPTFPLRPFDPYATPVPTPSPTSTPSPTPMPAPTASPTPRPK